MSSNQAAYIVAKGAPIEIKEAPYTKPGHDEIVIKNSAIAINPIDWLLPYAYDLILPYMTTPFILGNDVAGTVVEIGEGVSAFKTGDRVVGHAMAMDMRSKKNSEGAFQHYVVLRTNMASQIPNSVSFETAAVLPVALSTAATGLFMKEYLGLQRPTVPAKKSTGETVIIWGGSTSVGCNCIQLAVAAGYEVITTASPKNHAYMKELGAAEVFDYNDPNVDSDIIAAFQEKDRKAAGAYAIGVGSMDHCFDILAKVEGKKFIAQASHNMSLVDMMNKVDTVGPLMMEFASHLEARSSATGIAYKFIWGPELVANDLGKAIYQGFLPAALASGQFVAAPTAEVIGQGLQDLEKAFEVAKKGVSAKKLVLSL